MSDAHESPAAPPPPPPSAPPPPPPASSAGGGKQSENRTVFIALSYLWILALIPFLIEKEDQEVRWHAKHGLVLVGAEFVLWTVLGTLYGILSYIFVPLGCLIGAVMGILWIAAVVFHIMCIVKGVNGQRLTVPHVSEYADRF